MQRFEIIVNINGEQKYINTYDYEPISLNFNIADIQDISSRNSAYSKTIKVPDTRNNRLVFGDIGDLSILESSFNPNKKTRCWILVDTVVVFEGYLQLRGIIDNQDKDFREYEVVIYAENDNFFSSIGDDFLTDLDFSELNHTYSEENIVKSWTQSWNHGYYYPLIDYGFNWNYEDIRYDQQILNSNNYVKIEEMFPATNAKYIWNKIFSEAGFTYESDFLDSDVFEDLYIPYNRGPLVRDVESPEQKFSIGFTNTFTYSTPGVTISVVGTPGQPFRIIPEFRVPFNDENPPNGDPDGLYDTSTFYYTAPAQFIGGRFVCDFDIEFKQGAPNWLAKTSAGSGYYATSIVFKREFATNGIAPAPNPVLGTSGTVIPTNGSAVPIPFHPNFISNLQYWGPTNAPNRVTGQISTDILDQLSGIRRKLYPGERVWVEIRYSITIPFVGIAEIAPNSDLIVFTTLNKFYWITSPTIVAGDIIPYNQCIPNNFKQRDFIMSIVRMFNLYIEPSKDIEKHFVIEPRDQFYEKGQIKDWTQKLDISDIQGQVLGETQNRRTIFKYKNDTDYFNKDYFDIQAGISYGEYDYLLDNDFVKGEKKVEISFSPTPIVQIPDSDLIVIPKIAKLNNNVFEPTTHNVRILTKSRSKTDTSWNFNAYLVNSDTDYVVLADLTLTTAHNFSVGDIISVSISGNALLTSIFTVVSIPSAYQVEINIFGVEVGGGSVTPGSAQAISGLVTTNSSVFGFEGKKYRAYPYLGHYNNPFEPNYDINFGQVVGYYYDELSTTTNNLFETYYSNFMSEISDKDSRLITAKFYLTALDISDFRFNDNIFINNQYYKVNKIVDYDPGIERTTSVELIKTKFINVPRIQSATASTTENPNNVGNSTTGGIKPTRGNVLTATNANTIIKGDVMANGKGNIIRGARTLISGSNNTTATSDVSVFGNNNKVAGGNTGLVVFGSNNTVDSGAGGSFLFGNSQQLTEENTFMVSAKFVLSANIINASRNEVLNPFPDNKIINYLSASRNAVREPFSQDIVNIVVAGRFDETIV